MSDIDTIILFSSRRNRRKIMERYISALRDRRLDDGLMDYLTDESSLMSPDVATYALRTGVIDQQAFDRNAIKLQQGYERRLSR